MKKISFFGIVVLMTAIIFSFTACNDDNGGNGGKKGKDDPFMEMVLIPPAGTQAPFTFTMGNDSGDVREKPAHQVIVSGFYMGKYLVTQEQYQEIRGNNPSASAGAKKPVEQVSWYDAVVFCNLLSQKEGFTPVYSKNGETDTVSWGTVDATWPNITFNQSANGYRLPTSAEWEYACRAGTTSLHYTVDTINDTQAHINKESTIDVGSYPANPWGLYDMIGNLGQWCWDWVDSDQFTTEYSYYRTNKTAEPVTNPLGIAKPSVADNSLRRTWRGAPFNTDPTSSSRYRRLQSAYHDRANPSLTNMNDLGFRVVRNK